MQYKLSMVKEEFIAVPYRIVRYLICLRQLVLHGMPSSDTDFFAVTDKGTSVG